MWEKAEWSFEEKYKKYVFYRQLIDDDIIFVRMEGDCFCLGYLLRGESLLQSAELREEQESWFSAVSYSVVTAVLM